MKVLLSGPIEGYLDLFYEYAALREPHWVVCVGDYGIWNDTQKMDRAARKHGGTDFAKHYIGLAQVPIIIPTLTMAGAHDDNRWLQQRASVNNMEILNNVHWLSQGYRTTIGWDVSLRVTGLGRVYSESTYRGERTRRSHRHYTRQDVERGCSSGPTDLLVVYEHLDAPGIRNLIFATRPKLILNFTRPNRKTYKEVQGIPVIQLGKSECKLVEWKDSLFIL